MERRKLYNHIVEGDSANHQLTIDVLDAPGAGGAHHLYEITGFNSHSNVSLNPPPPEGQPADLSDPLAPVPVEDRRGTQTPDVTKTVILFQNGPIQEFGVNGLTNEAMIAIVIDRMRAFQAGPFKSNQNLYALSDLESALGHLQARTRDRIKRKVEGTMAQ